MWTQQQKDLAIRTIEELEEGSLGSGQEFTEPERVEDNLTPYCALGHIRVALFGSVTKYPSADFDPADLDLTATDVDDIVWANDGSSVSNRELRVLEVLRDMKVC